MRHQNIGSRGSPKNIKKFAYLHRNPTRGLEHPLNPAHTVGGAHAADSTEVVGMGWVVGWLGWLSCEGLIFLFSISVSNLEFESVDDLKFFVGFAGFRAF